MKRDDETLFAREAAGEATAAEHAEIARRAASDPAFARELARWRRTWTALELEPPASAPPGFAARVASHARAESRTGSPALSGRPAFGSATAALILAAGVALGAWLGSLDPMAALAPVTSEVDDFGFGEMPAPLADDFLAASDGFADGESAP